jgi:ribosome-associated protein
MNDINALNTDNPLFVAEEAVKVLFEKKALNVKLFDVKEYTTMTEYYVNVTGRSSTHVASLADELAYIFENRGLNPLRIEGKRGNSWILVDYGFLIVNVFDSQSREFYNFDRLLPAECEMSTMRLLEEVDSKFKTD